MRITSTATLAQIQVALAATRPDLQTVTRGWGSIYDDDSLVGTINAIAPAHDGVILPVIQGSLGPLTTFIRAPETLAARLYWYKPDPTARRLLPAGTPKPKYYKLQAADILINQIDGSPDFTLVVTTTDWRDTNFQIIPALESALRGIDSAATISTVSSVLDLGTPDFFLWLVHMHLDGLPITPDLSIDNMYKVSAQDSLDHETSIARGVTAGRLELLSLLADPNKSFGPAQVIISSALLEAHIGFDLELDGSFQVQGQQTHYSDNVIRSKLEEQLLITQDLTQTIIPSMKQAYQSDVGWHSADRVAYRNARKAEATAAMGRL
ncbi:hypothetical protein [Subtercola lobariae]|nr:hypothetical protein [Subtercola lobariae]